MDISVVIATIGREIDLIRTLRSIEANFIKPSEVLIIDQGDIQLKTLENFNLNLILIKINKKSTAQARNVGIELSKGDVITFLDDDVILNKYYFKEVLKSFENNKQTKIIQGKITNLKDRKLLNLFWGIFLGPGSLKRSSYVRIYNFEPIFYKSELNSEQFCMWASGSNMNVKREVFNHERFDSQLVKYSAGEDLDFSFRVHKRFGMKSILFQPKAQLIHNVASSGRLAKFDLMLMRRVHKIYFVYKNNKNIKRLKNIQFTLKQLWYLLGCMIINIFQLCKGNYKALFYFFAIEYQVFLHRKDIRDLNIEWMNVKLFNEKSVPKAEIIKIIKIKTL